MKSKQQKQQEAIERKRKAFPYHQQRWINANADVLRCPKEHAARLPFLQQCAAQAEMALVRAAKEAHVDRHGNPL